MSPRGAERRRIIDRRVRPVMHLLRDRRHVERRSGFDDRGRVALAYDLPTTKNEREDDGK